VDFLSFNTSLNPAYCSLQRAKIEASTLRRTLIAFQDKKGGQKGKKKSAIQSLQKKDSKRYFFFQYEETEVKKFYFCNIADQILMNYYCIENKLTLETNSSIMCHQYFNCRIILFMDAQG